MTVAQMITFTTDQPDRIESIRKQWEKDSQDARTATKLALYRVRGGDEYVQIVEFPDAVAAERNSRLDATDRWANEMQSTVGDMEFVDLELVEEIDTS